MANPLDGQWSELHSGIGNFKEPKRNWFKSFSKIWKLFSFRNQLTMCPVNLLVSLMKFQQLIQLIIFSCDDSSSKLLMIKHLPLFSFWFSSNCLVILYFHFRVRIRVTEFLLTLLCLLIIIIIFIHDNLTSFFSHVV